MGIYDRDYMRRPRDEDDHRGESGQERLESAISRFFRKHPRFPLAFGITLVVLVILALVWARIAGQAP